MRMLRAMMRFRVGAVVALVVVVAMVGLAACSEEPPLPEYLDKVTPPCVPVDSVDVDPCAPRAFYGVQAPGGHREPDIGTTVPYTIRWFLGESIGAAHLVIRGTYLPGTVRCDTNHGLRGAEWAFDGPFDLQQWDTKCYSDMRVNEYYLGSGPSMLTVMLQSFPGQDRENGERKWSGVVGSEEILASALLLTTA